MINSLSSSDFPSLGLMSTSHTKALARDFFLCLNTLSHSFFGRAVTFVGGCPRLLGSFCRGPHSTSFEMLPTPAMTCSVSVTFSVRWQGLQGEDQVCLLLCSLLPPWSPACGRYSEMFAEDWIREWRVGASCSYPGSPGDFYISGSRKGKQESIIWAPQS